jgi:hypothetical protein
MIPCVDIGAQLMYDGITGPVNEMELYWSHKRKSRVYCARMRTSHDGCACNCHCYVELPMFSPNLLKVE